MTRIIPLTCITLFLGAVPSLADDAFVGKWANVDDKTNGLTRIEIAKKDKSWTIQAWGHGSPREIDQGKVKLSLLGDSVKATEMKYGFASWDHNFADMHLTLQLEKDRLIVEVFDVFKDNSGRSNCRSRDEFKKTRAADQSEAVAAITTLGGKVEVDEDSPGKPVIKAILNGSSVTDADLEIFKGLKQLRSLSLRETRITGAGLKHLKGLTQLQTLDLGWTPLSDEGLEHLKDLTSLQKLVLDNTKVTDAGVKQLKGLTNLTYLNL